ncbi:MAG: mitochondrial fission ELM1 family protein [Rhodospirillales bacterium]
MENAADTAETPKVWALLDQNAGHRNQVLGVTDALGWPVETRDLRYNWQAELPNGLLGASLRGLASDARAAIVPPWPDLIVAAGRKTAPVARAIRRLSGGRTRLVQLMDPGSGTDDFALIAIPTHDDIGAAVERRGNVLRTLGAPHRMAPECLAAARQAWQTELGDLEQPRIAVFVGGGTRRRAFTQAMADELAVALAARKAETGGSLMITTSRRSGAVAETLLSAGDHVYRWGDKGDNPYIGYLAWADRIVVTGDSVSMVSDACASGVPVEVFAPAGLITEKHARFHRALYDAGYAVPFGTSETEPPKHRLDVAGEVAVAIRRLFD